MPEIIKGGRITDLKPGDARVIEAAGKSIALCNLDGTFYALDNTCAHRGGPLGEGFLDGDKVTCPWHGWQYELATGRCATNPAASVARYETRIEGDEVLIVL
ncbi:MAG TPA: Rieske 2Fe-2S domain-containing protein [Candidatus Polarisedimenticolia bacterium]|nr:Rieske 2Fe-2S domain-containing protein [Candidatus Polarisedimenticolia bacterium]